MTCDNVPNNVDITVLYTEQGSVFNPQRRVVGLKRVRSFQNWTLG